ncbi:type II toxin-antitoxin system death-on-curing family toxin [Streptosporangium sp. NBC_01756]|uniref:type II toxin-antitoxin system death-on-curing family toxin n=1 Tax=Streptosporangium sp. NBC_01756 TaxID=2975950 RepID=UPI002DDACEE0|nr:type II toxin-antitoxin system death-on-curing family toxin [Streptosporangium sp. NBC_01756]WSC87650.1 type II toxin-antitoxin system death-on-curing family toxin [Streptosporangium sp. NBC_01756]
MTRYLTLEQVLDLAELVIGDALAIRDLGLLDSAVHRPSASMFGQDAYTDLFTKAAALLQSLAINHPLVDGNKRLAWLATDTFLRFNDVEVDAGDDEIYDLVVSVAAGDINDLKLIAAALGSWA